MKKVVKSFAFIMALGAAITSCSKDDININVGNEQGQNSGEGTGTPGDGNNGSDGSGTGKTALLHFQADISNLSTKAIDYDPIGQGRYVTVYAYNGTNRIKTVPYMSTAGSLNPVTSGQNMSLVTGTYNLYAVGVNVPAGTAVPAFPTSSTLYTGLENKIDYIAWQRSNVVVAGQDQNITMNMNHSCTQVVIQMVNTDGVTISALPSMSITPSAITSSNTWNMETGEITPAVTINPTAVPMGVSKTTSGTSGSDIYYGAITMIPLKLAGNLTATFSITINNVTNNYKVELPVYQSFLQPGTAYIYKVQFQNNEITFNNSVNVAKWVIQDATGAPIIPTQIQ